MTLEVPSNTVIHTDAVVLHSYALKHLLLSGFCCHSKFCSVPFISCLSLFPVTSLPESLGCSFPAYGNRQGVGSRKGFQYFVYKSTNPVLCVHIPLTYGFNSALNSWAPVLKSRRIGSSNLFPVQQCYLPSLFSGTGLLSRWQYKEQKHLFPEISNTI